MRKSKEKEISYTKIEMAENFDSSNKKRSNEEKKMIETNVNSKNRNANFCQLKCGSIENMKHLIYECGKS